MIENITLPWYKFWNPQSGFIGGCVASLVGIFIIFVYYFIKELL